MTDSHPLAPEILRLRGRKSYGLIAKELNVTRNVVAGVIFRHDWPVEKRVADRHDPTKRNRSGTGKRGGPRPYAAETLPPTLWNNRTSK